MKLLSTIFGARELFFIWIEKLFSYDSFNKISLKNHQGFPNCSTSKMLQCSISFCLFFLQNNLNLLCNNPTFKHQQSYSKLMHQIHILESVYSPQLIPDLERILWSINLWNQKKKKFRKYIAFLKKIYFKFVTSLKVAVFSVDRFVATLSYFKITQSNGRYWYLY